MTDELDDLTSRINQAKGAHPAPDTHIEGPSGKQIGDGAQLAIDLVLCTGFGLVIGLAIDRYFATSPWFTVIFLILGIAGGFRNFYLFARKLMRPDNQQNFEENQN